MWWHDTMVTRRAFVLTRHGIRWMVIRERLTWRQRVQAWLYTRAVATMERALRAKRLWRA